MTNKQTNGDTFSRSRDWKLYDFLKYFWFIDEIIDKFTDEFIEQNLTNVCDIQTDIQTLWLLESLNLVDRKTENYQYLKIQGIFKYMSPNLMWLFFSSVSWGAGERDLNFNQWDYRVHDYWPMTIRSPYDNIWSLELGFDCFSIIKNYQ